MPVPSGLGRVERDKEVALIGNARSRVANGDNDLAADVLPPHSDLGRSICNRLAHETQRCISAVLDQVDEYLL